jgi:hypothetical protein
MAKNTHFKNIVLFIALTTFFVAFRSLKLWNVSPLVALALFLGIKQFSLKSAFFVMLVLSDALINVIVHPNQEVFLAAFYPGFYWQYFGFSLIFLIGYFSTRNNKKTFSLSYFSLLTTSLCSSLVFYAVSNFGVWFSTSLYPTNVSGLLSCYTLGLPFLWPSVIGDLFFCHIFYCLSLSQTFVATVSPDNKTYHT